MKKYQSTIALAFFVLALFWLCWLLFFPFDINGCPLVKIEKGSGLFEIANNLKQERLIKSKYSFIIFTLLTDKADYLKAGTYQFCYQTSLLEVANAIADGKISKVNITLFEGWDINDMAQSLAFHGICTASGFKKAANGLEGYLFPDTYNLERGAVAGEVVGLLQANFNKKVDSILLGEIEKQNKTLEQVVIMASILEKEVKTYSDKQMVAGILWKRLNNNWKLQVDATLGYVLGKASAQLTLADLDYDSPYNTYKYKGLPKGPICNPGLDSIKAAVFYKGSAFWYYLSKPNGETVFSKTLAEHEAARNKYLK